MAYAFQVDTGGTLLTNLEYYARMEANSNDVSVNARTATTDTLTYSSSYGKVNNGAITSSTTQAILQGLTFTHSSSWSFSFWIRYASFPGSQLTIAGII